VASAARKVVIVGFPGVQGLDVVGPHDAFTGAALLTSGGYDVVVASPDGQPVTTATGLAFVATPLPDPYEPVDTVVLPGGGGVHDARINGELVTWIKAVAGTARRTVTVCTGAFLAAEAGLLDGLRVTTHWAFAGRLAREFPTIDVDPDPIFFRSSDKVWTSAGVTAGIDLALSLVEDDHGTEIAQTVARWLVLYLRRPGGQTQFAAPVWMPRAKRPSIREVQEAIEAEPGGLHRIGDLARRATMSPASFHPSVHRRGRRGTRPLRRTHPHRSRASPVGGDRRHRRGDRGALRLRYRGNHAAQLHSAHRHLAGPVPQGLRLIGRARDERGRNR